jgi:hypothetical protein
LLAEFDLCTAQKTFEDPLASLVVRDDVSWAGAFGGGILGM